MEDDIKLVVRDNVRRLLGLADDESGVAKLMKKGLSNGNAQRILGGETSFGVDLLAKVAGAFGLQAWQLCVPGLDPEKRPVLHAPSARWPFRGVDQEAIASLVGLQAQMVEQGLLVALAAAGAPSRKQPTQAAA
jgi:hypothetical protein